MAVTTVADVTSLEQVGPAAINIALAATPMLAFPDLVVDCKKRISDAGGDTIIFPYWESSVASKTAVRNSREGVAPDKLTLKKHSEAAAAKVISVDGDFYAMEDATESTLNHLALLTGEKFGEDVQASLIAKATDATHGTDLELNISEIGDGTLSVDAILKARCKWADQASRIRNPVLFLRTEQFAALAVSDDYKTLAAGFSPSVVDADQKGLIVGRVHGIPLVLCDAIPSEVVGEDTVYTALLVGAGAFGRFIANDPRTIEIYHGGSTVKTIDTHFRFATTLFKNKPRRVVKLKTL